MAKKQSDCRFLITALQSYGPQSSWDWEADQRFAEYAQHQQSIDALAYIFEHIEGVSTLLLNYHTRHCGYIKRRRLRALRELKKQGVTLMAWGGFYYMGDLIRVSSYRLIDEYDINYKVHGNVSKIKEQMNE